MKAFPREVDTGSHQEAAALFHDPDIEGAIRRAVL
jgi:hypothetical protein